MGRRLEPGSVVKGGEIKLLSRLGLGGFGEVFLAQTPAGLRAVKVVDTSVWSESEYEVFNAMLMNEASYLRTLEHSMLPVSHGFFAEGSRYFLVMEWVKGPNLEDYVKDEGPLAPDDLFGLIDNLLNLLHYLHRQCEGVVVFGDLKPANVLRVNTAEYRLVDLGLVAKQGAKLSRSYAVFSPLYSAPERARGGANHPRQDMFSLAATVLFALSGQEPTKSVEQAKERVVDYLTDSPGQWAFEARQKFQEFLLYLMESLTEEPESRPASVRNLLKFWEKLQDLKESSEDSQTESILKRLYGDK